MTTQDRFQGSHVMRWWPLVYAAAWAIFATYATLPIVFGNAACAQILAAAGAVLMFGVAVRPDIRNLRIVATLVAIAFPLLRFVSLAFEPVPGVPNASRIVAMTAWATIALTLLFLYPTTWFVGERRGRR